MGLEATSIQFLESLYSQYRADPASVDHTWRGVFALAQELAGEPGSRADGGAAALLAEVVRQRGHLAAKLDPLGRDMDGDDALAPHLASSAGGQDPPERLAALYRSSFTVETAHIDDPDIRAWVREAFEAERAPLSKKELMEAHEKLVEAEEFEGFLGRKYPTKKRFGAEGAESLFPLMDRLFLAAARSGIEEIVVGPMHRGRTSLMGIIFGTPLPELFARFKGAHPFSPAPPCAADVPYHLGAEAEHDVAGRKLRVTLCPNPSHLEAVDPMVLGRVRAR